MLSRNILGGSSLTFQLILNCHDYITKGPERKRTNADSNGKNRRIAEPQYTGQQWGTALMRLNRRVPNGMHSGVRGRG